MNSSWILQMLNGSLIYMSEKTIFIRIFVASIVVLLLPLKDVKMLGKFNILLKFFKDLFLFGGIVMIIAFILIKSFLEDLNHTKTNADAINIFDFDITSYKPCTVRTTFFKWFFSFWKGYFNYDDSDCKELSMFKMQYIEYIDKALQNILWMVLLLKLIHTIETMLLPLVKSYMSKKMYPIIQLITYIFYIGCFVYYLINSETEMDDDVKNITKIAYNSVIIYSIITFIVLIIDKLSIIISNSGILNKKSLDKFPFVKEVNAMAVPNLKFIISANLFLIIGVFFKKYYEIKFS